MYGIVRYGRSRHRALSVYVCTVVLRVLRGKGGRDTELNVRICLHCRVTFAERCERSRHRAQCMTMSALLCYLC